jgi:hypothetical protein
METYLFKKVIAEVELNNDKELDFDEFKIIMNTMYTKRVIKE